MECVHTLTAHTSYESEGASEAEAGAGVRRNDDFGDCFGRLILHMELVCD